MWCRRRRPHGEGDADGGRFEGVTERRRFAGGGDVVVGRVVQCVRVH